MTRTKRPELAFLDELKTIEDMDARLTKADRTSHAPRSQDFSRLARFIPEMRV